MKHLAKFFTFACCLLLVSNCHADGMPEDSADRIREGGAPTQGEIDGIEPVMDLSKSNGATTNRPKAAMKSDVYVEQTPKTSEGDDSEAMLTFDKASPEKMAEATGHYARTRSLLIAAIREWDKGVTTASPDGIINSSKWRAKLEGLTHDLEVILDPQPRITRGGVKYDADTRLLNVTRK